MKQIIVLSRVYLVAFASLSLKRDGRNMTFEGEVELIFKFQGHSNSSISVDIVSSFLMIVLSMNVL